jgi:DNA-binding CsgD family transcriptional regulator
MIFDSVANAVVRAGTHGSNALAASCTMRQIGGDPHRLGAMWDREQDEDSWDAVEAFADSPRMRPLDIDCLAVGISGLASAAVQVKEILFLDGELHEDPETLQSHCASLIALWSTVQTPSLVDLGTCTCVGRRWLFDQPRLGRRFAIHAVPLDATRLLFVVLSSTHAWTDVDRVKAAAVELAALARQAHASDEAAGVAPQDTAEPAFDWYRFTTREVEILKLVASGLSNKLIARELGSSPNTVRNQIYAVFRKAEVSNRTELALRVASAA